MEQSLERLDQEITLHLQQIDSNLSYCFNKISQDVIPHVTKYGSVCDQVMDSSNWLKIMFQEAGNLQIDAVAGNEPTAATAGSQLQSGDQNSMQSLFPGKPRLSPDSSSVMVPPSLVQNSMGAPDASATTTTTTGQILRLPDSSDEERDARENDNHDSNSASNTETAHVGADLNPSRSADPDGSTIQRQRRKRKLSLLLQQQFGSSSSSVAPSPAQLQRPATTNNLDSSPIRKESTKQSNFVEPGTVIYFPTRDET
ncbi:LADA_0G08900g1_1 [Lachancea dasiensis]|uniref:DASH complex subunit ASK1 n=1 Tax=Lachancea dasiensis TaxID=1072105 RepID=A0A1G4JU74_9SACH|nr:LADA_0G08900g1_1 [Lachancea dasiensis]